MPHGARLTINGKAAEKRSTRHFVTPPLEKGQKFNYVFKAEFTRGNKTVTIARKVTLRGGQNKVVSLRLPGMSSRRGYTYGTTPRPANRIGVYSYRFTPDVSVSSPFGGYQYRDMRSDEDSVRD
jgi:uncharacterized protein (TIGR03000 family)